MLLMDTSGSLSAFREHSLYSRACKKRLKLIDFYFLLYYLLSFCSFVDPPDTRQLLLQTYVRLLCADVATFQEICGRNASALQKGWVLEIAFAW
jgi:hypothetical protein